MKTKQLFKLATVGLMLFNIALLAPPESGRAVEAKSPGTSGDNIAYMTVYTGGDFGTIDLATGAFILLGNSGQTLAGLGTVNGTLYSTSYHTNPSNLYTINPANGGLTLVGSSDISYDMFGSNTQGLYAIGSDANLYSINSTTGAATLIGPIGVGFGSWRNLSCGASSLYLANGANLYTLNTTTGAASLVGDMGGPQMGAMLLEGGVLYAGEETPGFRVDILDPITGVATTGPNVTGVSGVFGGLAPYPLPTGCTPPPPGMISWWPGDGNANDIQDGNDGTLENGATFATGLVGQAFSFDNDLNQFVQVPDAPNIHFGPTTPMSVDFWIYRTSSSQAQHFVGKREGCFMNDGTFQIGLDFEFTQCGLFFGPPIAGGSVCTGLDLPLNTWTHLAGTFDGTTQRMYMDGSLIGEFTGPLGAENNAPLLIGQTSLACTGAVATGGLMDEVEIFNRALS